jgi:hypothetical protein
MKGELTMAPLILRGMLTNGKDMAALLLAQAIGLYLAAGIAGVIAGFALSTPKYFRDLQQRPKIPSRR